MLAALVRKPEESAAEALRLAAELARTIDALIIEEVDPGKLAEAVADAPELARHWEKALERFRAVLDRWPSLLEERGRIDLTDRRNRLLRKTAERWSERPPAGFTVAAGITTAAPAIAALLYQVARMPGGMVVLPGLSLPASMPDEEWEALGPDDSGRAEETHPQFHLKTLLDRIGVARGEVQLWPSSGRAASPAVRTRAIAHAMTAADFSDKWNGLKPAERRLTGIRAAELPDPAAEAQAIAMAIRETLETRWTDCGSCDARSNPGAARFRASRPLGDRSRRQRGAGAVSVRAGHVVIGDCVGSGGGLRAGPVARSTKASFGRRRRRGTAQVDGRRAPARPCPAWPQAGGRSRRDRYASSG